MFEGARTFLASAVPWPIEGQDWWIDIFRMWLPPGSKVRIPIGRAFKDLEQAIRHVDWLLRSEQTDIYVCMSAQSRIKATRVNKAGWTIHDAARHGDHAVCMRSLWLDVDVKPGAYATLTDAIAAVGAFRRAVGLPLPTFLVGSGGGLHAHWVTDEPMDPQTWSQLARGLVNAAAAHGLKNDRGAAIDRARILRVPDTFNWKTGVGRPVQLLHAGLAYSVQRLTSALGPFFSPPGHAQPKMGVTPGNPLTIARLPTVPIRAALQPAPYQVYIGDPFLTEFDALLEECAWLKHVKATRGSDQREPLWRQALVVAHYCTGGRQLAHELSDQHPGYAHDAADAKYDLVEQGHSGDRYGWPQCRTIAGEDSVQCKTCVHVNEGKSPLNFAKLVQAPPVMPSPVLTFAGMPNADLPPNEGWHRDADGLVYQLVKDKSSADETAQEIKAFAAGLPITFLRPQMPKGGEGDGWDVCFTSTLNANVTKEIVVEYHNMSDARTMSSRLLKQGFALRDEYIRTFKRLMASFIETLRTKQVLASENLGWSIEGGVEAAFVFGKRRWNCTGDTPVVHTDVELGKMYSPTGQMDPWRKASMLVFDRHRSDLEAVLATTFAGPLVKLTGHSGLIVSAFSNQSGVGKTTSLKVGASTWGHPIETLASLQTPNYLIKYLTLLRHLPLFYDEGQTNENNDKAGEVLFAVGQGRGKGRLTRQAELQHVESFNTILMIASNNSIVDYIGERTKTTPAGLMRVFEFRAEQPDHGMLANIGDAQIILGALDSNYGHAGLEYAKFLGKNADHVRREVQEYSARFATELHASHEERFWIASMVTMRLGAKYANALGLTKFNERGLIEFLSRELTRMRMHRSGSSTDISRGDTLQQYIVDYVNDRQAQTVRSDIMRQGKGLVTYRTDVRSLRPPIRVHIAEKDRILRMSLSDFRTWMKQRGVQERRSIIERMIETGMAAMPVGAKTIASGFQFSGAREWVLEVDLTKVDMIE